MVDFDDSSASCSALLAGKVDLAYTTLDAAIIAESQYDEDMLDVTAIVDESAGADGILVKNDINSIADLKGKKVGVSINQTSHYLLMQALETAFGGMPLSVEPKNMFMNRVCRMSSRW